MSEGGKGREGVGRLKEWEGGRGCGGGERESERASLSEGGKEWEGGRGRGGRGRGGESESESERERGKEWKRREEWKHM